MSETVRPPQTIREHPAVLFNRWFPTAAAGEPFFPGLYSTEQLRAVCYLAFLAGQESLASLSVREAAEREAVDLVTRLADALTPPEVGK